MTLFLSIWIKSEQLKVTANKQCMVFLYPNLLCLKVFIALPLLRICLYYHLWRNSSIKSIKHINMVRHLKCISISESRHVSKIDIFYQWSLREGLTRKKKLWNLYKKKMSKIRLGWGRVNSNLDNVFKSSVFFWCHSLVADQFRTQRSLNHCDIPFFS